MADKKQVFDIPTTPLPILQPSPIPSAPNVVYQQQSQLLQALNYLLASPSIPLIMRKQFFMLWENVIFGNFSDKDILFLLSKFREWCISLQWYIPEQKWGNVLVYEDEDDASSRITIDLNLLLNMLYQLYFINLTRGKGGFTTKELNTGRSVFRTDTEESGGKKSIRLF